LHSSSPSKIVSFATVVERNLRSRVDAWTLQLDDDAKARST
jgi:hypothetical protein